MRNIDLKDIENALGFNLTEYQVEFLKANIPEACKLGPPDHRYTGATTAAALKILISDGDEPVYLDESHMNIRAKDYSLLEACKRYSGDGDNKNRYRLLCCTVLDLGKRLYSAGVDVRDCIYMNNHVKPIKNTRPISMISYELSLDTTDAEKKIESLYEMAEKIKIIFDEINKQAFTAAQTLEKFANVYNEASQTEASKFNPPV